MSGLAAQEPGRKHRVGPLEQPRQRERTARRQSHDDRFAEVKNRLGERALAPGQAEIGPARRLSAHRGSLAKAEQDDIGAGGEPDSGRYSVRASSIDIDAGGVVDPALRHGRLEPLQNGHGVLRPARGRP